MEDNQQISQQAPPVEAPNAAPREDVQQKYDRLYGSQPEGQAPTQTEQQAAPSPDPTALLLETVSKLGEELAAIKAQTAPKVEQVAAPIITPWFERLRQGDFEGAEKDITTRVRDAVTAETSQRAVAEAMEMMKIQMEVDRYLTDLRGQNPDIAPFERYLQAPVERRMQQAKESGKIKNGGDFVTTYKAAVQAEVEELRKISRGLVAQGKELASVRQREVLTSTPVTPQAVTSNRQPQQGEAEPDVSVESYFARRRQTEAGARGL